MTIYRHYTLTAAPGRGDELGAALVTLGAAVRALPGCTGTDLFRDADQSETFFFVEHWASREDHKAGGKALGKDAFAPVAACLSGPPAGRYLEGGAQG